MRQLYWRGGLHQTAVLERWPASDGCIGEVGLQSASCIGEVACIRRLYWRGSLQSASCTGEVTCIRRLYWRGSLQSASCIGEVACSQWKGDHGFNYFS